MHKSGIMLFSNRALIALEHAMIKKLFCIIFMYYNELLRLGPEAQTNIGTSVCLREQTDFKF